MDDTGLLRGELTFRQLGHFVAVAEVGSIAGAAQRLQFSPSAVSASISELERALGAQLCIRRRAQGVTLTPTGSLVLLRAKRLLADVAELNHAVHGGGELVGPLVVGCFHSLAPTLLPSLLEEFESRHPRVSIDFVVGAQDELQHDIIAGRIDAALMYDMSGTEQLERAVLFETRGYALFGAANPLAQKDIVTLEELAPLPLVLYDQVPSTHYATAMFEARGLVPNVRYRTHAFELTRSIVARSDTAYGILVQRPENSFSYEGLPIIERDIEPPPPAATVVFAWARGAELTPRADALRRLLRDRYPDASTGNPRLIPE
ncbi:LysR family transcriptional regulator [Microbacterium sp. ET2]|uniref:LysR family transcriptional regulator n=1 Tax=Microbacterium albipurpureum TaxID=3050384 RepID=UPI00259CBC3C|nr:LysR family transcriptional regulator [Microbacterium sp. ET2 (Ac-2212)]WJL94705.1 LysR family transcriptional regulator [Microbacterium sp. ET2 (Ac-2212)]